MELRSGAVSPRSPRTQHIKDSNMPKPLEKISALLTVRNGFVLSLAAATLLAGCVAEVRPAYTPPPPPPPAAYSPPPAPAPAAEYDESAPAPEIQAQATEPPPPLPEYT